MSLWMLTWDVPLSMGIQTIKNGTIIHDKLCSQISFVFRYTNTIESSVLDALYLINTMACTLHIARRQRDSKKGLKQSFLITHEKIQFFNDVSHICE